MRLCCFLKHIHVDGVYMQKNHSSGRVLILDTSAFIMGYMASEVDSENYSVPAVRDELSKGSLHRLRFDNAVQTGHLKVLKPSSSFSEKLTDIAKETGDHGVLSFTDSQLLALGLELLSKGKKPTVVSDDYSVQNTSNRLGLSFKSLATIGIKRGYQWEIYCPGCQKKFSQYKIGESCPICGTDLKRRPKTKRKIDSMT